MEPKLAPDSASNDLGGIHPFFEGVALSPLERAVYLLLNRFPESVSDFKALGSRLAKAIKRRKPYDGYYIKSIWLGKNPMTPQVSKAIEYLIAELIAEPPDEVYKTVRVLVPNHVHVPDGTVILRDAVTCVCGASFIPTIWNQINHTRACSFMRLKMRSGK